MHSDLEVVLDDIREYLEDRQDVVDGDYGVPKANREMQLLSALEDAMRKAGMTVA